MQHGRPARILLAVCAWMGCAWSSPAAGQSAAVPAAAPTAIESTGWLPPPQPYVPGPTWLTQTPAVGTDPTTLYPSPPIPDGWVTAYPYQYYPQGQVPWSQSGPASLLDPEPAETCFCTPAPCYFGTFFLDVIVLDRRSNLEPMDIYFDSTGAPVLNTADFNLETEAGVKFGFLFPSPCGNDWMIEYFGIRSFQDSITRSDAAGVTDVFFGASSTLTSLTAEYESNLDSLEFTVRSRQSRRIAPLAGIRYVQVDEHFNSMQDVATRQGWYSHSDNDLFGFQFGLQALIYEGPRWRLETTVKGGPYINDVDVNVLVNPPGQTFNSRHVSHWHTGFIGEVRLGVVWRLGPRFSVRTGYQALWIEGIALGPNQNNNISFATNLESVDLSGVLYQGGYVGFELTW